MHATLPAAVSALISAMLAVDIAPLQIDGRTPGAGDADVVVARLPPRCRPRTDDPRDTVDWSVARTGQHQIVRLDPATG